MKKPLCYLALALMIHIPGSFAGEADVLNVHAFKGNRNTFTFEVTVKHADAGWDHYADKWEILDAENNVLGTRILHHPHVNEQPFTRSLSGVEIPGNIKKVRVRAHDSVHAYGGKIFAVELP